MGVAPRDGVETKGAQVTDVELSWTRNGWQDRIVAGDAGVENDDLVAEVPGRTSNKDVLKSHFIRGIGVRLWPGVRKAWV